MQLLKSLINEAENHDNFQVDLEVRAALLHFLTYVYIDTPLLEKKLGTSPEMWRALVSVSKEMTMIFHDSVSEDKIMNEIEFDKLSAQQQFFDRGAKVIAAFFKFVFVEEEMNSRLDNYFDMIVGELRRINLDQAHHKCTYETIENLRTAFKFSVGEVKEGIGRQASIPNGSPEDEQETTHISMNNVELIFAKIDLDGNGFLSTKEVAGAIVEVNSTLDKGQIKAIMKKCVVSERASRGAKRLGAREKRDDEEPHEERSDDTY